MTEESPTPPVDAVPPASMDVAPELFPPDPAVADAAEPATEVTDP